MHIDAEGFVYELLSGDVLLIYVDLSWGEAHHRDLVGDDEPAHVV
jgi:hypothetical protein